MSLLSNTNSGIASSRLRFDRRELSGAFGDLGTDLPLLTGVVLASSMDAGWVFLLFGLMQVVTGIIYGIPMPLQPLKAVAALVIVHQIDGSVIAGGALAIALIMVLLTVSGAIDGLAKLVPKPVIRGIQLGLGLKLGMLALGSYLPSEGFAGWVVAGVCLGVLLLFLREQRFPGAVLVLLIGALYAVAGGAKIGVPAPFTFSSHVPSVPSLNDFWLGLTLLALPQVPLSIGNSMLATRQLADDWFPERHVTLRQIGATYSFFNLVAALFGGMPVCHGSGGMAGHYAFGARTGGSVVIYGALYLALGLACSFGYRNITALFPLPVLGVILLFEATALIARMRDVLNSRVDGSIAVGVGLIAFALPHGFLIGMVAGGLAEALRRRSNLLMHDLPEPNEP